MGIGAKIATVLAAGLVATGVGREAVQAVQANDAPTPKRFVAVQDNPAFSSVSTITGGRVSASPIAARIEKKTPRKANAANRFRGASKSLHGIAAARPRPTTPANSQSGGSTGSPVVPQTPRVTPPAIQVPPVQVPPAPQLPVQVPTVQLPPVTVPVQPVPVPPPPLP